MTPEAENRLKGFFKTFSSEGRPLLLLDYDGTLAPFRVDRFRAQPFADVRELLTRIQRQGATRMAVVTGRPAQEIAPLLQLETALEVWGLHGAERLYPDGRRELQTPPAAAQKKLDELRESLRRDSLGGLFEDKPNACVMHWRGLPPHKAKAVESRTRQLFDPLAEMAGLNLLEFEAGVELRVGRDKGGAVEAIVGEMRNAEPVAYLGDDLTDESAFRAVNALRKSHLSALVRRSERETAAEIWLRPPADLRAFLTAWAHAVETRLASGRVVNDEELAAV